ncbi:MAG TPA: hypothetical protein VLE95_02770 [Chlamydiales bacterium]|nr:hypothetical protein [Chlamydiales bacterium]
MNIRLDPNKINVDNLVQSYKQKDRGFLNKIRVFFKSFRESGRREIATYALKEQIETVQKILSDAPAYEAVHAALQFLDKSEEFLRGSSQSQIASEIRWMITETLPAACDMTIRKVNEVSSNLNSQQERSTQLSKLNAQKAKLQQEKINLQTQRQGLEITLGDLKRQGLPHGTKQEDVNSLRNDEQLKNQEIDQITRQIDDLENQKINTEVFKSLQEDKLIIENLMKQNNPKPTLEFQRKVDRLEVGLVGLAEKRKTPKA